MYFNALIQLLHGIVINVVLWYIGMDEKEMACLSLHTELETSLLKRYIVRK